VDELEVFTTLLESLDMKTTSCSVAALEDPDGMVLGISSETLIS
jgi:hypothetical protein